MGSFLLDMGDTACCLEPGEYKVRYLYNNENDFSWMREAQAAGGPAGKGKLHSADVLLTIRE